MGTLKGKLPEGRCLTVAGTEGNVSDTPEDKAFAVQKAADTIRNLFQALERDHGVEGQRVAVECEAPIKFTASIHCRH